VVFLNLLRQMPGKTTKQATANLLNAFRPSLLTKFVMINGDDW
jgi:hypothetical protein